MPELTCSAVVGAEAPLSSAANTIRHIMVFRIDCSALASQAAPPAAASIGPDSREQSQRYRRSRRPRRQGGITRGRSLAPLIRTSGAARGAERRTRPDALAREGRQRRGTQRFAHSCPGRTAASYSFSPEPDMPPGWPPSLPSRPHRPARDRHLARAGTLRGSDSSQTVRST